MSDKKTSVVDDETELTDVEIAEIEDYERRDLAKINDELAAHGINALPTVQAVERLAGTHLAKWRERGAAKAKG